MIKTDQTIDYKIIAELEIIPEIPGNGVAIPGQELTGGQKMYMALILPYPKEGKKITIDHLVDEFIQPYVSSEKQIAKVREVLEMYDGLEADTIFCLSYALQGEKFDEATSLFKEFHKDSLSQISLPKWMRCTSEKTFEFFKDMYKLVESEKHQ